MKILVSILFAIFFLIISTKSVAELSYEMAEMKVDWSKPIFEIDTASDSSSSVRPDEHPTKFCHREVNGEFVSNPILSTVQTTPATKDKPKTVYAGGCIHRPLRDVWAAIWSLQTRDLDMPRRADLDENIIANEKNLFNAKGIRDNFLVIHSTKHFYNPALPKDSSNSNDSNEPSPPPFWMIWWDLLSKGTYEAPEEVFVNFQKTVHPTGFSWGTTVKLEKVNETMTSFAMQIAFRPYDKRVEGFLPIMFKNLSSIEVNAELLNLTLPSADKLPAPDHEPWLSQKK